MKKFWNFFKDDAGERVLRLEGPIDEDSIWGNEITPDAFREELEAEEGDVTVWLNSCGGNVFAAAEIYNMLCDHKGKVTVKIDAIAASAASVVAMAGDRVLMSPVALIMLHDPMTLAMGNAQDMEKAITTLNEVKESLINAYARKTGLSRNRISKMMSDETWLNAKKAVELGFADEVLFTETKQTKGETENEPESEAPEAQLYSTRLMAQAILNRIGCSAKDPADAGEEPDGTPGEAAGVQQAAEGITGMFEEAIGEHPADPDAQPAEAEPDQTEQADQTGQASGPDHSSPASEGEEPPADTEPPGPADPPCEEDKEAPPIHIGLDGKTEDGAMPYKILRDKLDCLK